MASVDAIPQARVVRKGGQLVAPPRAPRPPPEPPGPIAEHARTFLAYAIGLWPLTGALLLAIGLIWAAALSGSP